MRGKESSQSQRFCFRCCRLSLLIIGDLKLLLIMNFCWFRPSLFLNSISILILKERQCSKRASAINNMYSLHCITWLINTDYHMHQPWLGN